MSLLMSRFYLAIELINKAMWKNKRENVSSAELEPEEKKSDNESSVVLEETSQKSDESYCLLQ